MTWSLWNALRAPNYDHPLYQRLALSRIRIGFASWQGYFFMGLVAMFLFLLVAAPMLLILLLVGSPLLYISLTATFFGVLTAIHISGAIARERVRERYELLCLMPDGGMDVNWTIFTNRMHQENILQQGLAECWTIIRILLCIASFMFVGGAISVVGAQDIPAASEANRFVFSFCIVLLSLSFAVYVDYVQCSLIGGLLGMVIGNLTRSLSDARLWSIGLFLAQQIVVYATVLFLGMVIIPGIGGLIGMPDIVTALIAPPVVVLCLYLMREMMIRRLWLWLAERLNSDPVRAIPKPFSILTASRTHETFSQNV